MDLLRPELQAVVDLWKAAGYRLAERVPHLMRCDLFLQKCIRSGGDKLYFIDVQVFDAMKYGENRIGVQASVQFNGSSHDDTSPTMNIEPLFSNCNPAIAEHFFKTCYESLKCEPYERAFQ